VAAEDKVGISTWRIFLEVQKFKLSNGLIDMRRKQPRTVARELLFDRSTFSLSILTILPKF
jgi:hypothetical protein